MNIVRLIRTIWIKFKWIKASPNQKAEMMRKQFYYLGSNVEIYTSSFGTEPYLISIHDNVTIAADVKFINHDVSCFNIAKYLGIDKVEVDKVGCIVLYENCFIGAHSILLPGTSVGKNSVIAAGSVVRGVIPDNEVWGGNPATFIMSTEDYARKVLQVSKTYPWKYDEDGHLLNIPENRKKILRQEFLFKKEIIKRQNFNN